MWLAVSPLMAAGVVGAHALAYRFTGTPGGPLHHYLGHVPQILLIVALAGLALGSLSSRLCLRSAWAFPVAAVATFVVQEHVERFVHTGQVPWLLESRFFLVGLVLQVPVALFSWVLARCLLGMLAETDSRRRVLPRVRLELSAFPTIDLRPISASTPRGRSPPLLQTS